MSIQSSNYIRKIAIIGGTGQVGSRVLKSLIEAGNHSITAVTRQESTATFPSTINVIKADFASSDSLTEALRNQDFLFISLAATVAPDQHARIVDAAVAAGIKWIMPNYFGGQIDDKFFTPLFARHIDDVRKHSGSGVNFIALYCGFWYEFSVGMGESWFGFDIEKKKVVLYGDGATKINTSTWEVCGDSVAKVLSLPVEKEGGGGGGLALKDWANKGLHVASFRVSQRDMLDSLHRVLGTKDGDWEIAHQDVQERYDEGMKELKSGQRVGFAKALYARGFFPNAQGDSQTGLGLDNEKLGVAPEDLDVATKRAVQMVQDGFGFKG